MEIWQPIELGYGHAHNVTREKARSRRALGQDAGLQVACGGGSSGFLGRTLATGETP